MDKINVTIRNIDPAVWQRFRSLAVAEKTTVGEKLNAVMAAATKDDTKMEPYRIENIQNVRLNGREVKLFKAFQYNADQQAYVFIGQFEAPAKTANKNLARHIDI